MDDAVAAPPLSRRDRANPRCRLFGHAVGYLGNEADESGYLARNQMYQDLRGYGWPDVARALSVERRLIAPFQEAADHEAEGMRVDDERLDCFEPSDSLGGLDLGVASATIALSAFSAIPVGSCNAGSFGGFHQSAYPLCRLLRWRSGPRLDRLDGAGRHVSDCETTAPA
jgi:hypothetical protein